MTDILAFGNNPKLNVKLANNSYIALLLGEIITSIKHNVAKNGSILLYLLL